MNKSQGYNDEQKGYVAHLLGACYPDTEADR